MAAVGVMLLAVLVGVGVAWGFSTFPSGGTEGTPIKVPKPDPVPPVMVVVGDSFTGGSAMNSGPEWPQLVAADRDWIVFADGEGGSGYAVAGSGEPVPERVAALAQYDADLVVIAAGANDAAQGVPPERVAAVARKVIARTRDVQRGAQVVLLSPFASGTPTPAVLALDDRLRAVAAKVGVPYIDVTRALPPGEVGEDGVHPTDQGHQTLAAFLAPRLAEILG